MDSARKISLVTGIFFIVTIIPAPIAAFVLYAPILNDPDYVVGAGADARVLWGAFLEVIIAIACVGTAVTLFPLLKRVNEGFALGYVAARVVESTVIVVGVISLLSVVTLRQGLAGAAGAEAASLVAVGTALVAIHDWTFLLGPGLMPGVNGVLLGYLLYASRLVPRPLALLGLVVAGPLLFASGIAVLLGVIDAGSVWQGIASIPVAAFEVTLGIWLIVKGFDPSALASMSANPDDVVSTGVDRPAAVPPNGSRVTSKG
ncbi:MAG TPA: DUF4386 domain-containing protein [Rubrobacter sp.]|nr:DUF4386 domain-containing protein [Rubrobacter sp.]